MLEPVRGPALLVLALASGWTACSGDTGPGTRDTEGATAGADEEGGTLAGAGAPRGAGGGGSGAPVGGAPVDCGATTPPAWASWPVPDPEADGGGAAQRYTLHDETATDLVTSLTWQRQPAPDPLDWQAASRYCACLALAGYDDWSLPSRLQLVSIVDYTRQNPALDEQAFPDTPFEWFWSGSPTAASSERAWYVAFWDGNTHAATTDQLYWARCVRQSTATAPRYELDAEGTVRDRSTGLTWQQAASAERVTWSDASAHCAALDLQGQGWRLPNMKELQTLIDESRASPAIDEQAFPGTPREGFWAATELAGSTGSAWFVSFDEGVAYNALTTHPYRYRCVR